MHPKYSYWFSIFYFHIKIFIVIWFIHLFFYIKIDLLKFQYFINVVFNIIPECNFHINYNSMENIYCHVFIVPLLIFYVGKCKEYLSSDSIDRSDANDNDAFEHLTLEFLNCLKTYGLPNHSIKLKVDTTVMLIRNLDQSEGLCNGTRLKVTRLTNHVIESKIISGTNIGNTIYIPRMSVSFSISMAIQTY